jgi:hypothetical protein
MNKLSQAALVFMGMAAALAACGGTILEEAPTGAGAGSSGTPTTSTTTSNGTGAVTTTNVGSTGVGTGGAPGTTTVVSATVTSTGVGAAPGTGGGPTIRPCPPSEPSGEACPGVPEGYLCTYGDSVRPDCRDAWTCQGGVWTTSFETCEQPPPGACPITMPSSTMQCPEMGTTCTYDADICYCGCGGGPVCTFPVDWQCGPPAGPPACPSIAPNSGTLCSFEGIECTYGVVCTPSGVVADCTGGVWVWQEVGCALAN